jgi:hypothetical protein
VCEVGTNISRRVCPSLGAIVFSRLKY